MVPAIAGVLRHSTEAHSQPVQATLQRTLTQAYEREDMIT
jgi:hypothetical protein